MKICGLALLLALTLLGATVSPTAARPRSAERPDGVTRGGMAAFDRARRYEDGESVPRDYGRAHALYCEAARRGDSRAFFNLGWMYLNGRGVAQDDGAAVFWLRKAAARGMPQAANLLRLLSGVRPGNPGCANPVARVGRGVFTPVTIHPAAAPPVIRAAVEKTARDVGVSGNLLLSMVAVKSGFDTHAVSPKNAMGLMQLLPETARRFQVSDPFDFRQNLHGGATYIRWLLNRFGGNLSLALAAYDAGEGAVASHGGIPPFRETRAYVELVTSLCRCGGAEATGHAASRGNRVEPVKGTASRQR